MRPRKGRAGRRDGDGGGHATARGVECGARKQRAPAHALVARAEHAGHVAREHLQRRAPEHRTREQVDVEEQRVVREREVHDDVPHSAEREERPPLRVVGHRVQRHVRVARLEVARDHHTGRDRQRRQDIVE